VLHDLEPVFERPGELLEAPRLTADGAVVFSDVNGGGVYRDGEPVVPKRRGVGGIVPHRDGGLVITGRTLLHGDRELHAADDLAGYNDLTTTPAGDVLVGALRFRPLAGEEPAPSPLLRVTGPGQATVLSEAVLWPNGVGLAPSGDRLYLNDYARRRVVTMALDGSGEAVFCAAPRGSADGLAVDAEGGVWIALGDGGGVARFTPDGELDVVVDVPADFVTSLSFSGTDVLITTFGAVFRGRSEVAGLPVTPAAV
jgi:gluconolactonase